MLEKKRLDTHLLELLDGRLLVLFAFPRRSIHLLRRQFEIDHLILERYLVAHDARCLRS